MFCFKWKRQANLSALLALLLVTSSCTVVRPYPTPNTFDCFGDFNDFNSVVRKQTANAYDAAVALQNGYACAANQQRMMQSLGGILFLGAAAAALNTGITANSASDRIASIGIAGAGAAGATTFLTNADRERAYLLGQKQAACIGALSIRYSVSKEDRKEISKLENALVSAENKQNCTVPASIIEDGREAYGKARELLRHARAASNETLAALRTLKSDVDIGLLSTTRGISDAIAIGQNLSSDANAIMNAGKAKADPPAGFETASLTKKKCTSVIEELESSTKSVTAIIDYYVTQLQAARPNFAQVCPFVFAASKIAAIPATVNFKSKESRSEPFEITGSMAPFKVDIAPANGSITVVPTPLGSGRVGTIVYTYKDDNEPKKYIISIQGRVDEHASIAVEIK